MKSVDIYNPLFVRELFDEMSHTYGITNFISSFGFTRRWRNQCVDQVAMRPGMTVCDLMTGMGECWEAIDQKLHQQGHLMALDFSSAMCAEARKKIGKFGNLRIDVHEEDIFDNTLPDACADCVISTFGLKTFSDAQKQMLAHEIHRILKPGGVFSLVEISVPSNALLQLPYLFYLNLIIPLTGKLFLGNPDNYRMLGRYTTRFRNCRQMEQALRKVGLSVEYRSYFFGCASGVTGMRE